MPFTGSHPAAVVPLLHSRMRWARRAPTAALVIGSMVPDVSLFLPGPDLYGICHSPLGIVTVDVALGLVGLVLWWAVLGPAARAAAPAALRSRLRADPPGVLAAVATPGALAATIGALAFGALTHVVWDELTHWNRWGYRHIAWLRHSHAGLAGVELAQYTSSLVGAAILVLTVSAWWRSTPARTDPLITSGAAPGTAAAGTTPPARSRRPAPLSPRTAAAGWATVTGAGAATGLAAIGRDMVSGRAALHDAAFLLATRVVAVAAGTAVALALAWTIRSRRAERAR